MFDLMRFRNRKKHEVLKDWIYKGLRCRVIQGPFSINGYCAVPKGHPDFGKYYGDVDVDVHGGLTFGEQGEKDNKFWPDENLYWFGFDTGHAWSGVWTAEMATEETERLAEQLAQRA